MPADGRLHPLDLVIFIVYILAMLGVGVYFLRRNQSTDDYYVGGRGMGAWHVGLSVVATDVGGGFSIGLGGLGFLMGLSGSWMLFTGLLGAWLAAVLLIPRVRRLKGIEQLTTFPQIFERFYGGRVALLAGVISAIGYIGFTSSQLLAGTKLAAATFDFLDTGTALWVMGGLAIVYTVMGGIKAVIYTDTIQWAILMLGLVFIGLPLGYSAVGGWAGLQAAVQPELLSLTNLDWQDILNWAITIIPIWFVGMTLYQRIYACRSEKEARRAWFIAGLFEWPVMAFMGVALGLFARVAAEQGLFVELGYASPADLDAEMGLPLLLRAVMPIGLMGIILSAYFSAILSTADSCLMAASGNVVTDILSRVTRLGRDAKSQMRASQLATLAIGGFALLLATAMTQVLDLMLYSYAFMVSGLLVPLVGGLFFGVRNRAAALLAMLAGGIVTTTLILGQFSLPADASPEQMQQARVLLEQHDTLAAPELNESIPAKKEITRINARAQELKVLRYRSLTFALPFGLDANLFGLSAALLLYMLLVATLGKGPTPDDDAQ